MPSERAIAKPGQRIWDWDVIQALYMGGVELSQIVQIPRFKELSLSYLSKRASEQKWRASREAARAEGVGQIAKSLIEKMGQAEQDHQQWLLDKLDNERRLYDKETASDLRGGKNQMERLKIINQLDETVRRQLGLDERKPLGDQQRNLGILISIQNGGVPQKGTVQVAVMQQPNGEVRATTAELEAAKLIQQFKEMEAPDKEGPPPPGIKPISPFKIKGEEPLVNEKQEKDIVDIINESGQFHAFEIRPEGDGAK
jgi:hypothetical protein